MQKKKSIMKTGLILAVAMAFNVFGLWASEKSWITDLEKAKAIAKEKDRLILLDFTGSDWCGPCIAMHKEVFSKKEFLDFAEKKLVLVEIDFPNRKKQDKALKKANEALAKKYDIEGFPTLILMDAQGKVLEKMVGYQSGGPEPFLAKMERLMEKVN